MKTKKSFCKNPVSSELFQFIVDISDSIPRDIATLNQKDEVWERREEEAEARAVRGVRPDSGIPEVRTGGRSEHALTAETRK